jgi:hypothetical protein
MTNAGSIYRRLQISGVLVIAGLLAEGVCLLWSRPLAFVALVVFGGLLISVGVLFFLYSLAFAAHTEDHPGSLPGKGK